MEKAVAGLDGSEKDKSAKKDDSKKDIIIELDNIEDRLVRLTPGSADLGSATLNKDGTVLYYQAAYEGAKTLWKYDLEEKTPVKIGSASGKMLWDSKHAYLYVLGSKFSKMKDGAKSLESIPVSTTMKMDLAAERAYVTGINKYSEIGNVSAVKMESVIQ